MMRKRDDNAQQAILLQNASFSEIDFKMNIGVGKAINVTLFE